MAPNIGNIKPATSVFLAPMSGYTDMSFRLAARELGGMGLAYTEMLNPRSFLTGKARKIAYLLMTCSEDAPLVHQIYGNEPEVMAEGARKLEANGAVAIDINMGCPQKKIVRRGAGAGMLRTPELAVEVARRVAQSVAVPVTAKIRLMRTDDYEATAAFARELEQCGIAALTVHARTCAQKFAGNAAWPAIGEIAAALSIPVIGNGDIASPEDAAAMIGQTGCAAVMIGRSALKNPWIVRQAAAALNECDPAAAPDRAGRISFMLSHLDRMASQYGETAAPLLFRRWIPHYARSLSIDRREMIGMLLIRQLEEMQSAIRALHAF